MVRQAERTYEQLPSPETGASRRGRLLQGFGVKVLIAGNDIVGYRIADALMASHEVTHLGPESSASQLFERLDCQALVGSVTTPSTLRQAQVQDADVFVACTTNDEQNIVACLAAQRLGAKRTVCMLTRPGFLSVARDDSSLAQSLGIDQVIRPVEQLADEIIRIVTVPGALDVQVLADGHVRLLSCSIEENAPITAGPLRSLSIPRDVVLVMLRRGEEMLIPHGDTHVQPGDKAFVMGRWRALRRLLFGLLRDAGHAEDVRAATIVGAGTVGVAVARGLEDAHWRVTLIEQDRQRCEEIAAELGSLVLHGDGCDLELLEGENVADSSVLVAVTNNDEKNLLVSLLAKHLGVPRIITRADRMSNERMFEKVGIDVVRSAHGAAIRSVVTSIDESASSIRAELEHGEARVIELELPQDFPRTALKDLRAPTLSTVGSIMRGRTVVIPRGPDVLKPGDRLLVFCSRDEADETRTFFLNPHEFSQQ